MTDTLFSARDAAALFPPRAADAHKGTFGYIALIGGSVRYCGAIRLANLAACAMRAGAGVSRLCAPADLCKYFPVEYDETGSIGKRYRRQDEIGTPFSICVDFETEETGTVTIRDRDTMEQERVPVSEVRKYIEDRMRF